MRFVYTLIDCLCAAAVFLSAGVGVTLLAQRLTPPEYAYKVSDFRQQDVAQALNEMIPESEPFSDQMNGPFTVQTWRRPDRPAGVGDQRSRRRALKAAT